MTFAVPELIQAILKDDCKVEMEPLDVNFADRLITHLHVPDIDLDVDILLQDDGMIKVEVWTAVTISDAYPMTFSIFDLNSPNFVKSITDFLLELLHGRLVKIRFPRRKDDNENKAKSEESDKETG